jgi:hypothetical protein
MMKKLAYTMITMLVALGLMAVVANAQTSGSTLLIANIPFEFHVGDQGLPAGEYIVRGINPASGPGVLQLMSSVGSASAFSTVLPVIRHDTKNTRLIFNRYGNQYFFAQAWVEGESLGLQAVKSQAERSTERELARLKQKMEVAALTGRH